LQNLPKPTDGEIFETVTTLLHLSLWLSWMCVYLHNSTYIWQYLWQMYVKLVWHYMY